MAQTVNNPTAVRIFMKSEDDSVISGATPPVLAKLRSKADTPTRRNL